MQTYPAVRILSLVWATTCILPIQAQTQSPFTVVSAANYGTSVCPNSLAAVFGSSLAPTIEVAKLDSSGQLPTVLGGVAVVINGQPAQLIYASPTQINLVIPAGTQPGTATVVINTANSRLEGVADVRIANPAIFSLDGSGKNAGAILNAITYSPGPFYVETLENGGEDKRTRLAVYATGIRYAGNVTQDPAVVNVAANVHVQIRDASGKALDLPVEYAGPAPGFFGLDQINVVLPADANDLGAASLSITAESQISNTVDVNILPLPASRIGLASISVANSIVAGGSTVTGTVFTNAPAPTVGLSIRLQSSNAAVAQVPMFVTVPAQKLSTDFSIQAGSPGSGQDVNVTASAGNTTRTASLRVLPSNFPSLVSVAVNPSSGIGGVALTGTITLSAAAPIGGVSVTLESNDASVQVPATVAVLGGRTTMDFTINTTAVPSVHAVTITASLSGVNRTASVTLNPPLMLTLDTNTTSGGTSVTGTVTIAEAAPAGGATVTLTTSDSTVARILAPVNILAGQTSAKFTVQTSTTSADRTVSITANYRAASQSVTLTVTSSMAGSISKLEITPTTVKGGVGASGTVTISGPAGIGGVLVSLTSNNLLAASVPMFVTVPSGQSSAQFSIRTSPVISQQTVTITATAGATAKSATLIVN
jgi:uncharacterized protein (TIGR03437 family)